MESAEHAWGWLAVPSIARAEQAAKPARQLINSFAQLATKTQSQSVIKLTVTKQTFLQLNLLGIKQSLLHVYQNDQVAFIYLLDLSFL